MAHAAHSALSADREGEAPAAQISTDTLLAYARDRLAAARCYPKDRLLRREFRLARLDLTVWFASAALAELCERALVAREPGLPATGRAEIYALDAEAEGWAPPATWREEAGFTSRIFEQVLAVGGLRGFYHHDTPSWQFYDPAAGVGVQALSSALGIPPWETGSPLRLFLHWAAAAAGMRLTHAATLGVDGRGALIAGAAGSGKSGTTLAGLLHGLDSVGDDYVLIEQAERVMAHPVFALLKQDPAGLQRAGVARERIGRTRLNWHGKVEFPATACCPQGLAPRLEIQALLIPRIARTARTRIFPASAREAALALAPSAVFQLPGDSDHGFRFLAELVRRLPAYHLELSENPVEIADAIGAFLTQGAGRSSSA